MRTLTPSTRDLERWLLQRGVGALVAGRSRCGHCHRTPLVGEHVHLYDRGQLLCDLCRDTRKQAPVATRLVRSAEHGLAVRHPPHAAAA
jgi:hypothetical protein